MYLYIYIFNQERESSFIFFQLEDVILLILSPVIKEEKYDEFIFAIRQ